jgi:hypothetical protein
MIKAEKDNGRSSEKGRSKDQDSRYKRVSAVSTKNGTPKQGTIQ